MDIIIGVDIGTSATKAVAFGAAGSVLANAQVDYPLLNPQPGWYEQEPMVLFDAVINGIAQVVGEAKSKEAHIERLAIGFSSAMHGLIAMDAHDQPLTNCIIWADTRSATFAAALKQTPEGLNTYLKTGTPIHAMSPLCKL